MSEVQWGGVVNLIREFTEEQVARGDEVLVLTPSGFPSLDNADIERWDLDRGKPATYLRAYRQLRRAVSTFRPDVVHLHSFVAGFLGRLPGAVAGTPIVYQPHAWSFDLREERLFQQSVKAWERVAGWHTNVMVTNCEAEIEEGLSIGVRTPGVSIGVAIDPGHFHPVDELERERHRRDCGVTSGRMLVVVGRLVRQKGQDQLVASWERRPIPDTELVLVGPGDQEGLAALAPKQWGSSIRAVGEQNDVRPWIWASDAVVLASRYETVALAVAEAMSCGRAVVATAVNGTSEVVLGGHLPPAGRIVPLGAMDELLDDVTRILAEPATAAGMAAAGRIRAEEHFSPATVADRLRAAYLQAIGSLPD
ncbi:glycosyltransferase [Nocardioides sp. AX2bis]|uniref:glycosyltransferase n=1 Tax=Nocardioides sp. AX2bis TaxID=2653157 RepID=UPI0012F173F2|nr:glycosyltransferase [Nocardioides sp. AX2bis]VXC52178.1 putative Alpha-maltose-1-phosphate synthase [Nocardioides sp. AX2bis]